MSSKCHAYKNPCTRRTTTVWGYLHWKQSKHYKTGMFCRI